MNSQYMFYFPNKEELLVDHSYKEGHYHKGDLVFFEGEDSIWRIKGIQHQLRRKETKYIMTIILLETIIE